MHPDFSGVCVVGGHTSQSGLVHVFVSRHEVIGASLQPSRSFDTHPAPTPREIPHHVMLTQSGLRPRGVCVLLGHGVSATSSARAAASSERAFLPHRTRLTLSPTTAMGETVPPTDLPWTATSLERESSTDSDSSSLEPIQYDAVSPGPPRRGEGFTVRKGNDYRPPSTFYLKPRSERTLAERVCALFYR